MTPRLVFAALAISVVACGPRTEPTGDDPPDAFEDVTRDAGEVEVPDAASDLRDAGALDAGDASTTVGVRPHARDGGWAIDDAGFEPDASVVDPLDAGALETTDAGPSEIDAGPPEPADGGPQPRAFTPDTCAPTPSTIPALAQRFASEVYPLLTRTDVGCVQCHAAEGTRLMRLGTDGNETFYRLRAGGFLGPGDPSSVVSRLVRPDKASRMPQDAPAWAEDDVAIVHRFACDLAATEQGSAPADEAFPAELLTPYSGPAATAWDDTILTWDQLRSRIRVQFGDDWVRSGVNLFAKHVAMFGGVDFVGSFVPQRQVTSDYLLGVDLLALDTCGRAARQGSGPFLGLDTLAPLDDEPAVVATTYDLTAWGHTSGGLQGTTPKVWNLWSNGEAFQALTFATGGLYEVTVTAVGQEGGPDLPRMALRVENRELATWNVPAGALSPYAALVRIGAGANRIAVAFTNDYYEAGVADRNLVVQKIVIRGPLPGSTGGAPGATTTTRARLASLFEAVLLRAPHVGFDDELAPLHELLRTLDSQRGDRVDAWAGVCEALVHHPDFLFTRPPSFDAAPQLDRGRLLLVKTALDLVDRPPTRAELVQYDAGRTRESFIEEWLQSPAFRDAVFKRLRVLLESNGSAAADEPARLWTHLVVADRPIHELLTAEYTVDESFQPVARAGVYGPTGVLAMPGYLRNKPGLPHYNFAARVLSDFLGYVFEVPALIVDMRAGATAASTVDPTSVCYSCHQLLTPLAYQRLKWADDGTYRTLDAEGNRIDDSDRGIVASYPYKGSGLAAFSAQAVRKERFLRRMANVPFEMFFGRPIRHESDERGLYLALWLAIDHGDGHFRDVIRTVLASESYTSPIGSRAGGTP